MRQPFAVTFTHLVNKAPEHRPAKMEQETVTVTVWAKDETWARRIASVQNGISQSQISSITPKWS
jgi:hypothetical protein